jgi:hypothetical protein
MKSVPGQAAANRSQVWASVASMTVRPEGSANVPVGWLAGWLVGWYRSILLIRLFAHSLIRYASSST